MTEPDTHYFFAEGFGVTSQQLGLCMQHANLICCLSVVGRNICTASPKPHEIAVLAASNTAAYVVNMTHGAYLCEGTNQ